MEQVQVFKKLRRVNWGRAQPTRVLASADAKDDVPSHPQRRHKDQPDRTGPSDDPSSAPAVPRWPAGRSKATEAPANSTRRSAPQSVRVRDGGDKTASKS